MQTRGTPCCSGVVSNKMQGVFVGVFIVLIWSIVPSGRRAVMDTMECSRNEASWALTLAQAVLSALVVTLAQLAGNPPPKALECLSALPAQAWMMAVVMTTATTAASLMLSYLLATQNPGVVLATLNAGTNLIGYLVGATLYAKVTFKHTLGAACIAIGAYVMHAP